MRIKPGEKISGMAHMKCVGPNEYEVLSVEIGSPVYRLLKEQLAERRKWATKQPGYYRVRYSDYAKLLNILEHLL